jgi:hypothetical protein
MEWGLNYLNGSFVGSFRRLVQLRNADANPLERTALGDGCQVDRFRRPTRGWAGSPRSYTCGTKGVWLVSTIRVTSCIPEIVKELGLI